MALVLPNPTVPTNGQPLDASPLLANILAIAQAIQSFDASQVAAGTLSASAFNASINPNTLLNDTIFPFVQSGLAWSIVSGLSATMSGGVAYINTPSGTIIRVPVSSIASNTFTASKDTYIYVDYNGNVTYSAVANNATSPSATANAILVAIVVTGASTITAINQGSETAVLPIVSSVPYSVVDGLGNLIYPRDPNRKLLGLRRLTTTFVTTNTTSTLVTPLSLPVIVPTGRKIKVGLNASDVTNQTLNDYANLSLFTGSIVENTNRIDGVTWAATVATTPHPTYLEWVGTPAGGANTYLAGLKQIAGGTAQVTAIGEGGDAERGPAVLKVELE